ncbi:MAG TPA: dihydropteroate synthase, partial [Nocardioidaceae bacterium]|nr:dihydropteroate synthase [Nocardioidaceae bacterium]
VAARGGAYAGMHWRAHADTMQQQATYDDVVDDVTRELSARVEAALGAGIEPQRLALDPGLGFAKTAEHNWTLLAGLDRLHELGFPLLVGSSRKTFLGRLLAEPDGTLRPALEREEATSALTTLTASAGAWCVRVHQVRGNLDAVRVAQAWARAARARTPGGARG